MNNKDSIIHASYIIYNDDGKICAKDSDGKINYSSSDAARVINGTMTAIANSGGNVFVKEGSYDIASSDIKLYNNVHLQGAGWSTQFNLLQNKKIFANGRNNIKLSDFLASSPNHSYLSYAIHINDSSNVLIDHVRIKDANAFGIGMTCGASMPGSNITVQNCYLNGLGNNDVIGGGGGAPNKILGNVILADNTVVQDAGLGNHYAVAIDMVGVYQYKFINNTTNGQILFGAEGSPNSYSLICGNILKPALNLGWCHIHVATMEDYLPTSGKYVLISDNILEKGRIKVTGTAAHPSTKFLITNNIIDSVLVGDDDPFPGIYIIYADNFVISNNIINNAGRAMNLSGVFNSRITGNNISNSIIGIRGVTGSGNLIISDNTFNNVTTPITGIDTTSKIFNNIGYVTEANILSNMFTIDSIGIKTIVMAHRLNITPSVRDCHLTVVENTAVDDWTYNLLKIVSTDAKNVVAKINISTASTTSGATAKLALRVCSI